MNPTAMPPHPSYPHENLTNGRAANPKYARMPHMPYMDYGKITASHAVWYVKHAGRLHCSAP
jgi:hypothetical protein